MSSDKSTVKSTGDAIYSIQSWDDLIGIFERKMSCLGQSIKLFKRYRDSGVILSQDAKESNLSQLKQFSDQQHAHRTLPKVDKILEALSLLKVKVEQGP